MTAEIPLRADVTGSVAKILVQVGDQVSADDVIVVLESMKMEIPVTAPNDGIVTAILVEEGNVVEEDQVIALVRPSP